MKVKLALIGYFLVIISLFLYSFTQIDLGLALTRFSIWQEMQKFFQHIGYFKRPLSTEIYIIILVFLFSSYFLFMNLSKHNKISKRQMWGLILAITVILTFSYNAFSYDLFNNIFDAKIVTFYHQNPYVHKALDYPGDPMLSFMHWTHRTYPYGPTWLGFSAPLSFLGLNLFLPTFFLFKALTSASFLGTAYFIGKILKKVSPKDELLGTVFFAFNPLVIIESLVSSHNDITMLFFAVWALYLYLNNNYIRSFILLFLSIGVKFATVFLLPILLADLFLRKLKKNMSFETIILSTLGLMTVAVVIASVRTNFQPWYLLYVLPFASLAPLKYFVFIPSIVLSLSSLLLYVPYLYLGNWNPPVPTQLFWITTVAVLTSMAAVLVIRFKNLLK